MTLWHILKLNCVHNKISLFFLISLFLLLPLADIILTELLPESLQLGALCLCTGARHSENVHLIHNTVFVDCANFIKSSDNFLQIPTIGL